MFIHTNPDNYDKSPATHVDGTLCRGWEAIRKQMGENQGGPLYVDMYTGVYEDDIIEKLGDGMGRVVRMSDLKIT